MTKTFKKLFEEIAFRMLIYTYSENKSRANHVVSISVTPLGPRRNPSRIAAVNPAHTSWAADKYVNK